MTSTAKDGAIKIVRRQQENWNMVEVQNERS